MNWGFESGTAEGWAGETYGGGSGITNVTISSSMAHTGSHSLAITLAIGDWSTNMADAAGILIPLCTGTGSVNLAGYTFTAWVRFGSLGADVFPMNAGNYIQGTLYPPDMASGVETSNPKAVNSSFINTWTQFGGTLLNPISNAGYAQIAVQFPIADFTSEGFQTTMYLDDIQILPP